MGWAAMHVRSEIIKWLHDKWPLKSAFMNWYMETVK